MGNIRQKQLGSRNVNVNYDSNYRVTSSVDTGTLGGNSGGNTGTRNFLYDSRGNVTSLGGLNFVYDSANQPITLSGTTTANYKYDGNLKRVKSVTNGKTIYNVYNKAGKLIHIDNLSTNEKTDYVEVNKQSIARVVNNVPTYLHTDILGSPVAGTNTSGTVTFRERYTPFGLTLDNNNLTKDQAGFTGHIKDSDTDLNYMQARYYDPVIGRFLSNDPVGYKNMHSFNRYAYANNNPINAIDPDGRETRMMVEAAHLDMDVAEGKMTMGERQEINKAQFDGMVSALGTKGLGAGIKQGLKKMFSKTAAKLTAAQAKRVKTVNNLRYKSFENLNFLHG